MVKMNSRLKSIFISIFVIFCVYFLCIHYADTHDASIIRDRVSGEISISTKSGVHWTAPWVSVAKIDLRPSRVCIETTARVANCKLVKFKSEALGSFVKREGFKYYWLSNRLSLNVSYKNEYRGVRDYLRAYAFGGTDLGFLEIIDEYHE